ncbi:MoaD/ThiS family protein [Aurantiacibacter aquimixticola]|uniref:MoaD/ThiS family protein n=1 Tax=Aurantiacibacter aquimixticola TaxID=1958945 RepID=A0A419RQC7_9SPHN|nr:MoaD/ThiS family protein [Aurantiacibacter aquimixticola]RJY08008.1 MoaD/ThiS family protein [Aurantiacibacter aquimixticola]
MAVRVILLGKLADLADDPGMTLDAPVDWRRLLDALGPELADAARQDTVRVAVDGDVLGDKTALDAGEGAEVALLPPVSGG